MIVAGAVRNRSIATRSLLAALLSVALVAFDLTVGVTVRVRAAGASSLADEVLADGPVSFWRFEETSGTTAVDATGNHHGTVFGGVTLGVPGPTGKGNAFQFDGTGYVNIGNRADLSTPNWSLEAWVKGESPTAGYVIRNRFYGWGIVAKDTRTSAGGWTCGDPCSPVDFTVGTPSYVSESWHHVAVVKATKAVVMYVDGVEADRTSAVGPSYYNAGGGLAALRS